MEAEGLIGCVCQACAAKTGALDAAERRGSTICGEMGIHPSLVGCIQQGCQVITF